MVKDHSDSVRGNPFQPHKLLLPTNSKGLLYAPSHRTDSTYHGLCYTSHGAHTMALIIPVMEHWLEQEIAQCLHPMKDRSDDPSHHELTLLPRSYILLGPKSDKMASILTRSKQTRL